MLTLRLLKIKIHSRRVLVFKRCLPIFAFLLVAIMIAWPMLTEQKEKFSVSVPSIKGKIGTGIDMDMVRFFSKDKKNNPLKVSAVTVKETDSERKIVTFESPKATYEMSNGLILTSVSPYALAFQEEKYLYFERQVDTTTDTGYHAISKKVVCDYNEGSVGSDQSVHIKGPAGMLNATSFFINEKGNKIYFKGTTETLLFKTEKEKDIIESLKYEQQKKYLKEDKKNTYITSENGLFVDLQNNTITAEKNVNVIQDINNLQAEKLVLTYGKDANDKNKMTKLEAYDNVLVKQKSKSAQADSMFLFKNETDISSQINELNQKKQFENAFTPSQLLIMSGRVRMKEDKNVFSSDKMYVFYQKSVENQAEEIKEIIAQGHVNATNGKQVIIGNWGVYNPVTGIITVYENVHLKENNSVLQGEKATLNLKTGINSLSSSRISKRGRVKGSLIPAELEQRK